MARIKAQRLPLVSASTKGKMPSMVVGFVCTIIAIALPIRRKWKAYAVPYVGRQKRYDQKANNRLIL